MEQDKIKKEENNQDVKALPILDESLLANILLRVNQTASIDNQINQEEHQDQNISTNNNNSNNNNKETSQEGGNENDDDIEEEEKDNQGVNQNQTLDEGQQKEIFNALIQSYQQSMLNQQQVGTQNNALEQPQQMEQEEEEEEQENSDEGEEDGESGNDEGVKHEGDKKTGRKEEIGQIDNQQQFLQFLMQQISQQQNIPLTSLQQQAIQFNQIQRGNNPLNPSVEEAIQQNYKQEQVDAESGNQEDEDFHQSQNQQHSLNSQINPDNSHPDKLSLQRLLKAQQAQFQNGDNDEDIQSQIRELNNQSLILRQQIQNNQIEEEEQEQEEGEEQEEEEEEETKQTMHKQFLDKQYREYLGQQQNQFKILMNEIKNLDQYMQNPLSQEQRNFAEQKHSLLLARIKQVQHNIQECTMNPNQILEQIHHNQMQKSGESMLSQQMKEFSLHNNPYFNGSEQIGRNMQLMQEQEHNIIHQQQVQYQAYLQSQEKVQPNHQNHPLVNFFNSYSLFINDTANIQLDQEIVLNKLIENAKKCKPPSNADERVNYLWNYLTDLDKKQIEDFEQQLKSLPEQNIYECIQTIEKLHIKLLVEYNIEVARGKTLGIIKQ